MRLCLLLLALLLSRPLPVAGGGRALVEQERVVRAAPDTGDHAARAASRVDARLVARVAPEQTGPAPNDESANTGRIDLALHEALRTVRTEARTARPPALRAESRPYDATAPPARSLHRR